MLRRRVKLSRPAMRLKKEGLEGKRGQGLKMRRGWTRKEQLAYLLYQLLPRKMEKMTLRRRGKQEALGFKIWWRGKKKRQIVKAKKRPR